MGVGPGGCPHAAIREDASMNLTAIESMNQRFPNAELCFIESGGDNLAATFSPELADLTIYVIDVAAGEKIPRKGGPGITRSDLLVINKTDLAPLVGANLDVMEADTIRMRVGRRFIFTQLKNGMGVEEIARFIIDHGGISKVGRVASPLTSFRECCLDWKPITYYRVAVRFYDAQRRCSARNGSSTWGAPLACASGSPGHRRPALCIAVLPDSWPEWAGVDRCCRVGDTRGAVPWRKKPGGRS